MQDVTYYSRDGVDYAVFAFSLDDLRKLAVLTVDDPQSNLVGPPINAAATLPGLDDSVRGAIAHLEARRVVPEEPDETAEGGPDGVPQWVSDFLHGEDDR